MHHIAIMKKSWGLIPKILAGEKTIESRWYKNRVAPWNKVHAGDVVYFKNSGEPVTAKATVTKVLQFSNLNQDIFQGIIDKYANQIGLKNRDYNEYYQSKNYCILIFLEKPQKLEKPFKIDKTGYGMSTAWISINDVEKIKQKFGKNN